MFKNQIQMDEAFKKWIARSKIQKTRKSANKTKLELINKWFKRNRKPSQYSKKSKEIELYCHMTSYLSPSSSSYDEKFRELHNCYFGVKPSSKYNKAKLIDVWYQNEKRPSIQSDTFEEKRIATLAAAYLSPSSNAYDEQLRIIYNQFDLAPYKSKYSKIGK